MLPSVKKRIACNLADGNVRSVVSDTAGVQLENAELESYLRQSRQALHRCRGVAPVQQGGGPFMSGMAKKR